MYVLLQYDGMIADCTFSRFDHSYILVSFYCNHSLTMSHIQLARLTLDYDYLTRYATSTTPVLPTSFPRLAPLGHICITSLTPTAFLSPPWRNTLILVTASILIYPYLPSPSKISQSPSLSPEAFAQTQSNDVPMVTRLLAKFTPESKIWSERNDRHLELSTEKAGERLLFQEAERPRVHRMRYPR